MDATRPDSSISNTPYGSWVLLFVLTAVTPFVYAYVQGYWSLLLVPVIDLLSATGRIERTAIMVSMNFTGAILCAAMVAMPAGYLLRMRASLAAGTLVIGLFAFKLSIDWDIGFSGPVLVDFVRAAEYIGILIAFWLMAGLGAYARTHTPKIR